MSQALVTTKLRAPRMRSTLVARQRLREILDRNEPNRLTLVSAPAGFGKTTLLGEWSEDRLAEGCSVAWVSLESLDNDLARYLTYLVSALRTIEEGLGEGILASLRSPESPLIEAVIGTLVNELAGIEQEITVVLDDYHVIGSEAVHEATSFLLEHLPANVHLVISSRTDPPLPLPRLRARNQITELRAADLRFTPEEATAFLGDVMGLAISARDVEALEEATEGWIAALQLAALSMRDRDDISGFVESFSGSNRHVLDFLAEEVLERQPEDVRKFLLETSVLERMSAPLCDAITGRSDGQEMLERLERENLFVVALDDERRWHSYHHLFAEFLRGRLVGESLERAGEMHLRASGWYEENGYLAEAIGHALSAADYERAARLIEGEIKHAWNRGEGPTVLRWLEALPVEAKRRRPRLFVQHAQVLVLTGRPDGSDPLLEEAERAAEATGEDRAYLLGFASAVRSWRARLRGDAPNAVELARRALTLLPEEDAPQRIFAAFGLGEALRTTGELAAASEAFAEAAELGRRAGRIYGPLMAMVWQARVQSERGRLREAEEAFRRALRFVREQGAELLPAAGVAHIGMGAPLYERDDLEAAERELQRGIELAERTRDVGDLVWGYVTLSRAKRARGDEEAALKIARKADRVARTSGADPESAIAANWMVRLYLARGELAQAAAFEQERVANANVVSSASRIVDRLTSARLLHARGRHEEALGLLEELGEAAAGRTGDLIEILALEALALWAGNKKERAVNTLTQVLALAQPEGYVRTFADEGTAMGDLLSEVLDAQQRDRRSAAKLVVPAHYLAKLLAALAREESVPAPTSGSPSP